MMIVMKRLSITSFTKRFLCWSKRAIDMVDIALNNSESPIYVRHEIVHNKRVVNDLKRKEFC